mmetsp:Transcript_75372/g.214349  ORF Transcript_75372/g.214349 Transcript_75372/m.214349 type:complete len:605 (-) Transcript_75372:409-2223(-)
MGFTFDNVLPGQDAHTSEFTCSICMQLVEYPVYTKCVHVFCASCLQEWFKRSQSCPCCKTDLSPPNSCTDLKVGSPLAHRILLRVKVRCPLHTQGCQWQGDYSEVHAHLTNSQEHLGTAAADASATGPGGGAAAGPGSDAPRAAVTRESALAMANALKEEANGKFQLKQYADAITLYTKAISVVGDVASFHNNRAAAHFMLRNYRACEKDCGRAVLLDPAYHKAHVRRARAMCELGDFTEAAASLGAANELQPSDELAIELARVNSLRSRLDEGIAAYEAKDFSRARVVLGDLLRETNAVDVVLWAARAEMGMGLCDRAIRLTLQVIRSDKSNPAGYVVRGLALFLNCDFSTAEQLLKEALRLDPDHDEAKRTFKMTRRAKTAYEQANQLQTHRQFEAAIEQYSLMLTHLTPPAKAPLSSSIHAKRASCYLRLKRFDECLRDTAVCLYAADDNRDAWMARASALHGLGRHQEAYDDMQGLMQTWGQGDTVVRHAYERADFEVRKEKRPDYYALIGCLSVACESEIKSAYKKRALEWHPDKWMDQPEDVRKVYEEKFKHLGHVLEILCDPFKRQLYDEGYDRDAIEERVAAAQKAAHQHPNHRHH